MANTAPKPGSIPHALTEPPFSPPVFIGRDKELENLHQRLFDTKGDQFLLMVNGQGGMGKTSLASRYYHQHQQEYHHVAWVLSNKNIRAALLQLAPGLGLDFAGSQLPPEEQLKVVMQQLTRLPSPSLLVIDNANEVEDLREHFLALQRCSNLHLILTSRITSFSGANFFPVQGLAQQAAQDLFKRYYPAHRPEENDLLSDMIEAVGHNTLIIELLAKNLNQINRFQEQYTLQNLLNDLQDNILLLSKSQEVSTAYQAKGTGLRHQSPEFIVLAMYDLRELDELQQQMMGIFALLPNEEILYSDLQLMLPELEFQAALAYLTDHGWVDYDQEERSFKVNQVVQDVVRAKRAQFLRQDANLLINTIEEILDNDEALSKQFVAISRRLLRFAESCLQNIPHWDKRLLNLCWSIGDFYRKTGDLYAALESYELMSKMSEGLVQADPDNRWLKYDYAVSYQKIGATYTDLGDLRKALIQYEKYYELSEELNRLYPDEMQFKNGLAISYEKLGSTHSSLGNLSKALEYFEDETKLFEELYRTYPDNVSLKRGLAISYSKLGETHSSLGNLSKALEYFEERSRLGEELYRTYPDNVSLKRGLAISYSKLGSTHSSLGNLSKALEYFEDGTELFEELYRTYPDNVSLKRGLAISYSKLGETHSSLGNLSKALEYFEDETELFEELYRSYPDNVSLKHGLAISYEKLGTTHSSLGNLNKALEYFEDEATLMQELYHSYPDNVSLKNGLAISYEKLGSTHSSLDNLSKALEYFEERSRLGEELYRTYPDNVSLKRGLAISYEKLGSTHSSLGNLNKALEYFEDETELFEELYHSYPDNVSLKNGLAIAYWKLGNFHRKKQEDPQQARHYFQLAEQHWSELVELAPAYAKFKEHLERVKSDLADLA